MNALPMTRQDRQVILDVDFPLDADTDSAADVARIVGTLLDDVAGFDRQASHADILQALSIATTVRLAMADTAARQNADLSMKLLDIGVESEREVAIHAAQ